MPFAPGGLTDVPARLAATMLQEKIGQNIVIENKTGGSGVVGATFAARATPDGYTLFANSLADTQNIHYLPTSYSPVDDFEQIGWIVDGPALVLVIDANLPHKTLADVIADAKANPKKFSIGTSGPASSPGLSLMQVNLTAKTEIVSGALSRLRRGGARGDRRRHPGRVHVLLAGQAAGGRRQAARSRRRDAEANPGLAGRADVSGAGLQDHHRGFVGLAAPAKTPKPIVQLFNKHLNEVVQTDAFKQRMAELGMAPPPATTTRRRSSTHTCARRSRGRAYSPSCRGRRSSRSRSECL